MYFIKVCFWILAGLFIFKPFNKNLYSGVGGIFKKRIIDTLSTSAITINGLKFRSSINTVEKKLGKPDSIAPVDHEEEWSDSDSLYYYFRGYQFHLVGDSLDFSALGFTLVPQTIVKTPITDITANTRFTDLRIKFHISNSYIVQYKNDKGEKVVAAQVPCPIFDSVCYNRFNFEFIKGKIRSVSYVFNCE